MMYDPDHYLLCPMDECGEPLALTWALSMTLDPTDQHRVRGISAEDAHTATWQVECMAGHVLLLPGRLGCPCPDGDQDEPARCPHTSGDYDWSEDTRTFRGHDTTRLFQTLALLTERADAK